MLVAVLGGINPHRPDKCVRTDLKKSISVFWFNKCVASLKRWRFKEAFISRSLYFFLFVAQSSCCFESLAQHAPLLKLYENVFFSWKGINAQPGINGLLCF